MSHSSAGSEGEAHSYLKPTEAHQLVTSGKQAKEDKHELAH